MKNSPMNYLLIISLAVVCRFVTTQTIPLEETKRPKVKNPEEIVDVRGLQEIHPTSAVALLHFFHLVVAVRLKKGRRIVRIINHNHQ